MWIGKERIMLATVSLFDSVLISIKQRCFSCSDPQNFIDVDPFSFLNYLRIVTVVFQFQFFEFFE
jgi:hypothetical protein